MVFDTKSGDNSFKDLHTGFNNILISFEKIKIEQERNIIFFKNAIEHVGIGLLSFQEDGEILFSNKAFIDLFNLKFLRSLDQLQDFEAGLPDMLGKMKNSEQKLLKILVDRKIVHLSIRSSDFLLDNQLIRIVSFQDIKNEIEQNEMDAWQKLIRVLTHEIMNSVSPVTLLSSSLIHLFETDGNNKKPSEISEDQLTDLLRGLHTINRRSKGLSKFVEDYRNLTQLSKPNFINLSISNLFQDIETLFKEELSSKSIDFEISASLNMMLSADKELLDQVIINLIKNSIEAVEKTPNPKIELSITHRQEQKIINVTDNGKGIPEDMIGSIFIPFFTTKENGSGIGLSLSRQIMRLHNGIITVESTENERTTFSLVF